SLRFDFETSVEYGREEGGRPFLRPSASGPSPHHHKPVTRGGTPVRTVNRRAQWAMHVVIYHESTCGHVIEVETQRQGQEPYLSPSANWKGLGIPEPVLNSIRTAMDALLTEHLVSRYGVQGELPVTWAGEPEPF